MKEHYHSFKKDDCAQKIQAVFKGYSIRKHFLAVRLRFERIVKNLEANTEIEWKSHYLCRPEFHDSTISIKIKEIEHKQLMLTNELEDIEKAISERKEFLRLNKII